MLALTTSCLAATSAALCNLTFRHHTAAGGDAHGLLTCHYLVSLIFALCLNGGIAQTPFSAPLAVSGAAVGLLNIALMLLTHRALRCGPSGLSYAMQNASCLFPGLVLCALFGREWGFDVTTPQLAGLALVLGGFGLSAMRRPADGPAPTARWTLYASGAMLVQACALTLIQWRCLLWRCEGAHPLAPFAVGPEADVWFMPALFGAATLVQGCLLLKRRRRLIRRELLYGIASGTTNGLSTLLLARATGLSTSNEAALIFPCFAVTTILLCNLWAKALYRERFDPLVNGACAVGIALGMAPTAR